MKKYCYLIILFCISSLQEDIIAQTIISKSIIDSLSLFHPLQNGNIWQYTTTDVAGGQAPVYGVYSSKVIKDTTFNNKKYAVIEQTNDTYYPTIKYCRFDTITANYYEFNSNLSIEVLIDSTLSNSVNSYSWGNLSEIKSETILGMTTISRWIKTDAVDIYNVSYNTHYAFGLGRSQLGYSGFRWWKNFLLNYAKIDGKEYGTYTSVKSNRQDIPVLFSLSQNYPNPFNPSTIITYKLSQSCHVSLKIFNVLGKVVSILVDGNESQGEHSIVFYRLELPSGVYFYKIRAGSYSDTKIMLLLK